MEEDISHDRPKGRSMLYLLRFAKPFRARFGIGFCLLLCSSMLIIGSARLLGEFVQQGLVAQDFNRAARIAIWILALEAGALITVYFGRLTLAGAAADSLLGIRRKLFQHGAGLPLSYFDRQPLGRTVTRMTHDVESMESFFGSSMGKIAMSMILFLACIVAMVMTEPFLGSLLSIAMLPAAALTFYGRNPTRELNREIAKRSSMLNATLAEYLNGISVIRSFALEDWSKNRYDRLVDDYLQSNLRLNRLNATLRPMIGLLCSVPLILLVWIGGWQVLSGAMQIGLFVTFVRYCERFSRPIAELAYELHVMQTAIASGERVAVFLNAVTENEELGPDGDLSAVELAGGIAFQDVSMHYRPGLAALKGVSFVIEPGQRIGLAGATGSGKSTTVSLLARLYEFQEGRILIDGTDIRRYSRGSLRARIGFVSQDVTLFRASMRDNLTLGTAMPDEAIDRACRITGLEPLCRRRGLSLDSEVLDQGANLSQGERQLVALTRVLLANPAILVMDEATANVDPQLEVAVQSAVDAVMSGRTCIIVAHRLQTLRSCERLLIFKNGEIRECGSHDELLAKGGYYRELWNHAIRSGQEVIDRQEAI